MNNKFIKDIRPFLLSTLQCSSGIIEKTLLYYFSCGHKCYRDSICCICYNTDKSCTLCIKKPSLFKNLDSRCYIEDNNGYTIFCVYCRKKTDSRFCVDGTIMCYKCKYNYIKKNLDIDCMELDGSIVCFLCEKKVFNDDSFKYCKKYLEQSFVSLCSKKCYNNYKFAYMLVDEYIIQNDSD